MNRGKGLERLAAVPAGWLRKTSPHFILVL